MYRPPSASCHLGVGELEQVDARRRSARSRAPGRRPPPGAVRAGRRRSFHPARGQGIARLVGQPEDQRRPPGGGVEVGRHAIAARVARNGVEQERGPGRSVISSVMPPMSSSQEAPSTFRRSPTSSSFARNPRRSRHSISALLVPLLPTSGKGARGLTTLLPPGGLHVQRQQLHHLMPPDPTPPRPAGRETAAEIPAALRHDGHDFVHLLDRQQRAEGPAVAGLATAVPAGGRRFRAQLGLEWDPRKAVGRSSPSSGPVGLPARGRALAGPHSPRAGRRSPDGASPTAPGGRSVGSRQRRPELGRQRQRRLDHAAVVAGRGHHGKLQAGPSSEGLNGYAPSTGRLP